MKLLGWTWSPYKILVESTSAQINMRLHRTTVSNLILVLFSWDGDFVEAESPVEVGLGFTKGLSDLSSALLTHRGG